MPILKLLIVNYLYASNFSPKSTNGKIFSKITVRPKLMDVWTNAKPQSTLYSGFSISLHETNHDCMSCRLGRCMLSPCIRRHRLFQNSNQNLIHHRFRSIRHFSYRRQYSCILVCLWIRRQLGHRNGRFRLSVL